MKLTSSTNVISHRRTVGSNSTNGDSVWSRIRKFQIVVWVTVAYTFIHLGAKPMLTPPPQMEVKNNTSAPEATAIESHTTNDPKLRISPDLSLRTANPLTAPSSSPKNPTLPLADQKDNFATDPPTTAQSNPLDTQVKSKTPLTSETVLSRPPKEPPYSSPGGTVVVNPVINSSLVLVNISGNTNYESLSPKTKQFVQQYCDLRNLKDGAWYPKGDDEWQLRAPYFIIAGTWNSGVNHLATALLKHPLVDPAKIHGFFLPKTFNRFYFTNSKTASSANNGTVLETANELSNIRVFVARDRMYHAAYNPSSLQDANLNTTSQGSLSDEQRSKHVAMDVSPGLLFYAASTSYSIQCVTPWTKSVILLRNPVDRVYYQWVYSKIQLNLLLSLEDWIAQDMKAMQSVGLIGASNEGTDSSLSSSPHISEKEAWKKYQMVIKNNGAVLGRSMYVFQLSDWIQSYLDADKEPTDEVKLIASEHLEENVEHEYLELIRFLGLAPVNLTTSFSNILSSIAKPSPPRGIEPMSKETRSMLNRFFQPYNARLAKLLKEHGFAGDWERVWN